MTDLIDYFEIRELPSHFRFYKDKRVYIRGLTLREVEALAKYSSEDSFKHLIDIYKDSIKLENHSIYDLEMIDFFVLASLVSVSTISEFSWTVSGIKCPNVIKNPEIQEIERKIQELEEKEPQSKDEIDKIIKEIQELEKKKAELPKETICNNEFSAKINVGQLDFEYPQTTDIQAIQLKDETIQLYPITVKKQIEFEDFITINKIKKDSVDYRLAHYSAHFDNSKTLQEWIDILDKLPLTTILKIKEKIDLYYIQYKPVQARCPKCFNVNKVYFYLDKIKVYP